MRYSDIKERYIYYVQFNPIMGNEFKKDHLSVVLKKNNDKRTAIVMPLTSSRNGEGENKVLLDEITSLPERLKGDKSYAVYDQVRTVDFCRFQPVFKDLGGSEIVEVNLDNEAFAMLVELGTRELEKQLSLDERMIIHKKKFNESVNQKIINLAYEIKRNAENEEKRKSIEDEILAILYNSIKYTFTTVDKENGIENIISSIVNRENSIENTVHEKEIDSNKENNRVV